jgi:hypothetical protein
LEADDIAFVIESESARIWTIAFENTGHPNDTSEFADDEIIALWSKVYHGWKRGWDVWR